MQQLLESVHSSCAACGLTISIPKRKVLVFSGGHPDCTWKVAGQHLQRSQSFTYLGMLSSEDRKTTRAIQVRFSKICTSLESTFSTSLAYSAMCKLDTIAHFSSMPYCSLFPCVAVKSGSQLMQQLACFGPALKYAAFLRSQRVLCQGQCSC